MLKEKAKDKELTCPEYGEAKPEKVLSLFSPVPTIQFQVALMSLEALSPERNELYL